MENVLVSAFLYLPNHYQDIDFYIKNGKSLMAQDIKKIIFMDTEMYCHFKEFESKNNVFILIKKEDLYLYKYLNLLDEKTDGNVKKDNNLFYAIMCNKTEFVKQAIESETFSVEHYIWVDFGIFKILDHNVEFKHLSKQYNKVRIGNIWNLDSPCNVNLHTQICWYFAGGVFGGHKDVLLSFSKLMKREVLEFMKHHNHLLWEVNLWYFIYQKNKDMFHPYQCDHNNSLINNY